MMSFPINLAVNAMQPVSQVGNYVYYSAGSAGGADPSIKVKTDGGDEYTLLPGQGFRLDGRSFNLLMISNAGNAATIIGKVLIADGGFFDNRVTGSVEVIEGGKNRSLGGGAFCAPANQGAGAGQGPAIQLWNPPGSQKRIIVSTLTISPTVQTLLSIYVMSTALATAQGVPVPKLAGSAAVSIGQTRVDNATGGLVGSLLAVLGGAAYATIEKKFVEPIIVPPGYGIAIYGQAAASQLAGAFEFFEEANA